MQTDCNSDQFEFEALAGRRVIAAFDGGEMTSDAGALLLRHTGRAIGLFGTLATCFIDRRAAARCVHPVQTMLAQRICAIALGCEDLNDHDTLRHDPVLGLLSEGLEPKRADCARLAGKSTLNRLPNGLPLRLALGAGQDHDTGLASDLINGLNADLVLVAHRPSMSAYQSSLLTRC